MLRRSSPMTALFSSPPAHGRSIRSFGDGERVVVFLREARQPAARAGVSCSTRAGVSSPEQLLQRLSGRLDLLKAGRGADPRQQTLRATIEWSHDLLTGGEQRLFARMAVFRGGCTLEEPVRRIAIALYLDTLQSLVDKNLLASRKGATGCWRRTR